MEKFFHLKENGTTVSTEILAGLTTFFAMSYIIVVNPQILHQTGMPWGGVFLATIIAAIIGTLVMGLFANVPYAQAAGMSINAFLTYRILGQKSPGSRPCAWCSCAASSTSSSPSPRSAR